MDSIIIYVEIFFSLLLFCVIVLKKLADTYVNTNRQKFVDYEGNIYRHCLETYRSLMYLRKRFNDILNKYELNKTVPCSISVVSRAENDNVKYILKYSGLSQDRKCVYDLDFCCNYVCILEDFHVGFSNLFMIMKNQIPKIYLLFLSKRQLYNILIDCCGFDEYVVYEEVPIFTFYYRSPQGKSVKVCRIELSGSFLLEVKSVIEDNLDQKNYTRRQRSAMTKELREYIKKRDNYTCHMCGNSIYREPNLLLEIDHIIPVSKGGRTEPANLQTLCWKCNRYKSNN